MSYRNTWTWKAHSATYDRSSISGYPDPEPEDKIMAHFYSKMDEALGAFVQKLMDAGIKATLTGYHVEIQSELVRRWMTGGQVSHYYSRYRTHTIFILDFDTDKPVGGSPIAPAMVVAIGVAIAIILAGIGTYEALRDLTTESSTVTYEKVTTLPDGTVVKEKKTEKTTQPSLIGILSTGIILILIVIVALIFFVGFPRRR